MSFSVLVTQPILPNVATTTFDWSIGWSESPIGNYEYDGDAWICDREEKDPTQYGLRLEPCVEAGAVFKQLVERWRQDRGVSSSTADALLSHSYQSIIGMGQVAVPLILSQLEAEGDDPDQWFWALQVLTGCNPVPEDEDGNFRAMAQSWISWGRKRYAW